MKKTLVLAAMVSLVISACGDSESTSPTATETVTVTAEPEVVTVEAEPEVVTETVTVTAEPEVVTVEAEPEEESAEQETSDDAFVANEIEVLVTDCGQDSWGDIEATVRVTNLSSETMSSIHGDIEVLDEDGVRFAELLFVISNVAAGQTVVDTAIGFDDAPSSPYTCQVMRAESYDW